MDEKNFVQFDVCEKKLLNTYVQMGTRIRSLTLYSVSDFGQSIPLTKLIKVCNVVL